MQLFEGSVRHVYKPPVQGTLGEKLEINLSLNTFNEVVPLETKVRQADCIKSIKLFLVKSWARRLEIIFFKIFYTDGRFLVYHFAYKRYVYTLNR